MKTLSKYYTDANKLQYELDGKINEIYMGFEDETDLETKQFMVQEKIGVLEREVQMLQTYFKQLRTTGDREGNVLEDETKI